MKKLVTILFAGALMLSLASCGGAQKENKEAAQETQPQVAVDTAGAVNDGEKALADFETYVTNYVDVIKKMKSGDTKVISDYSKYSQQLQQFTADMARYQIDFTSDQNKRLEAAQTKLNDALKSLNDKK